MKTIGENEVEYEIEPNEETVIDKGAVCESLPGCSGCDKVRNWFLGPVKGCKCNSSIEGQCKFISSDTDFLDLIIRLTGLAASIITIIKAW